jgi:hypothetical protein
MSVYVFVSNPIDDHERRLSWSVCAESTYKTFFYPIAQSCGLDLCNNWGTFNEVEKADLDRFISQIEILLNQLDSETESEAHFKNYYLEKFEWIIGDMKLAASRREYIVFYIG